MKSTGQNEVEILGEKDHKYQCWMYGNYQDNAKAQGGCIPDGTTDQWQ